MRLGVYFPRADKFVIRHLLLGGICAVAWCSQWSLLSHFIRTLLESIVAFCPTSLWWPDQHIPQLYFCLCPLRVLHPLLCCLVLWAKLSAFAYKFRSYKFRQVWSLNGSCCKMQCFFFFSPMYLCASNWRAECWLLNCSGDFKPFAPSREIFKSPTISISKPSEDITIHCSAWLGNVSGKKMSSCLNTPC